jgi:hypothetical protein
MKRLSALTEPVVAHATENQGALYTQICSLWPNIVDEISQWSHPKILSFAKSTRHNGTLTIWVAAGRGPEAQARSQEIINATNMVCGFKAVGRITCQQTFELSKKIGRRVYDPPQNASQTILNDTSPSLLSRLEQQTNNISCPELTATLIRLGSAINLKNGGG